MNVGQASLLTLSGAHAGLRADGDLSEMLGRSICGLRVLIACRRSRRHGDDSARCRVGPRPPGRLCSAKRTVHARRFQPQAWHRPPTTASDRELVGTPSNSWDGRGLQSSELQCLRCQEAGASRHRQSCRGVRIRFRGTYVHDVRD
jgi:hypothetical protein